MQKNRHFKFKMQSQNNEYYAASRGNTARKSLQGFNEEAAGCTLENGLCSPAARGGRFEQYQLQQS